MSALVLMAAFGNSCAEDKKEDAKAGKTEAKSIQVNGTERTYRLHLPPGGAKEPLPLVVCLHGAACNGFIQETMTGFSPLADKEGFAVVYPDGRRRFWDIRGKKDVEFIAALLDELVKKKVADPKRIYVCGLSMGGFMSSKLALDLGERIAAIAPVAGTMPKPPAGTRPKRPIPLLYIHGDKDRIVSIKGNRMLQPADAYIAWWAEQNGCAKPATKKLPDQKEDGTTVEITTHAGKAPVIYYKVIGGGHTWPGGGKLQIERLLGKTCKEFDASETMWKFFKKHQLPE